MKTHDPACLVSLRVWGDFACFTRPEMKAERVSYELPTPSAARGVLEAIFYEPQMMYVIHEIGVIQEGRWFSFRRNEVTKVVSFRDAARAMEAPGLSARSRRAAERPTPPSAACLPWRMSSTSSPPRSA